MHCTQCGAHGEGRFCGACGATLRDIDCRGCGAGAPAGRRFCTACGAPLRASDPTKAGAAGTAAAPAGTAAAPAGPEAGWWVAGVLLVVVLVGGGWAIARDGAPPGNAPAPGASAAAGGQLGAAPHIDLSSMTPREAADALFDRIMAAVSRGDDEEVLNFLPMAISAYEWARPLDLDGTFHLSLLHSTGSDFEAGLAVAHEALADSPDHLLNLATAAQAALGLGDEELAARHYAHLLEVWDEEQARRDRPGYEEHARLLPDLRREAEAFLEGRE